MRLFFALWPPHEAARALADWAGEAARELGGKATAEDKIHLTLAFLGEAKPEKAIAGARRVRGQAHELLVQKAVYWKQNSIIWAGPHVTPVRKAREPRQLPELPRVEWPVNEFLLVRSISGRYEPLERFPIA